MKRIAPPRTIVRRAPSLNLALVAGIVMVSAPALAEAPKAAPSESEVEAPKAPAEETPEEEVARLEAEVAALELALKEAKECTAKPAKGARCPDQTKTSKQLKARRERLRKSRRRESSQKVH
ncbi:MAG: hypothetical protein ACRBN8_10025 [Nannocystales bacterium]